METRPYFRSLRGKITNRILFVGILPILIIGAIAWFSLNQLTSSVSRQLQQSHAELLDQVVGENLTAISKGVVQQLDTFMLERISDVVVWASAPTVVDAAIEAAKLHREQGLTELSIEEVEARFQSRKSLNVSPETNRYLIKQIERSQHFGEVFFTDSNGFNTALTNPTSDFVQRDESWWRVAWENGISLGEVEFDESAGIWSVDISVRINDPRSGSGLGVMKAVLGVSLIQEVADSWAREITDGTVTVANSDGLLLAETATGHAQERIMNPQVSLRESNDPDMKAAFGTNRQGYVIGDKRVLGYSKSAGADLYQSVAARFQGFNWSVVVQQPTEVALAPIQGLSSVQRSLADSQKQIVYVLLAVLLVVFVLSILVSRILARRITTPILRLREMADAVSKGETGRAIRINSDDEIQDLAAALERLRASVSIILKRYKTLKNKVG